MEITIKMDELIRKLEPRSRMVLEEGSETRVERVVSLTDLIEVLTGQDEVIEIE